MQGDQKAIAALYHHECCKLRQYVGTKLGNVSEAEDVVQDAYVRMMTMPADHPTLRNATAFLFTVASNLAIDIIRREQRFRRIFSQVSGLSATFDSDDAEVICARRSVEDEIDGEIRLGRVMKALDELPSTCRKAFVMHKVQEYSYFEVAAEMGVTVSMVEKHLSRALRHLRQRKELFDA